MTWSSSPSPASPSSSSLRLSRLTMRTRPRLKQHTSTTQRLKIINYYCHKYKVTLVPSKTKLLCISKKQDHNTVDFFKMINPIELCHQSVIFSDKLEHVGITRSVTGNLVAISERITAQKRALGSLLTFGLARSHLGNPQAGLKVLTIYGTSVLFSGVSSLYLNKREVMTLNNQHNNNVRNIQRLFMGTPRSFYLLVGGSLPGEAILHSRQLSLFGMICR